MEDILDFDSEEKLNMELSKRLKKIAYQGLTIDAKQTLLNLLNGNLKFMNKDSEFSHYTTEIIYFFQDIEDIYNNLEPLNLINLLLEEQENLTNTFLTKSQQISYLPVNESKQILVNTFYKKYIAANKREQCFSKLEKSMFSNNLGFNSERWFYINMIYDLVNDTQSYKTFLTNFIDLYKSSNKTIKELEDFNKYLQKSGSNWKEEAEKHKNQIDLMNSSPKGTKGKKSEYKMTCKFILPPIKTRQQGNGENWNIRGNEA